MSSKAKRIDKQAEREAKMLEEVSKHTHTRKSYLEEPKKASLPNRMNIERTEEEEMAERQRVVEDTTKVYRKLLPGLLVKLNRIEDYRRPGSVKHKHTVLLLYGILMFMQQVGSRREANRTVDTIQFENMKAMFPELETLPHADTLARLLEKIKVEEIQNALIELVSDLIRRKKFRKYLIRQQYLIAIDGTQKLCRDYHWEEECLVRHTGPEKKEQSYVYVLESLLVLDNGISLPLMSEFLKNDPAWDGDSKQDCERKAFTRLAGRLKKAFPKLKITLLMDGLYACGPVIQKCQDYGWGYMIVFKEGSIPDLWHEAIGLMWIAPENNIEIPWGDRKQLYIWANDVPYEYMDAKSKRYRELKVHVVYCHEEWTENHCQSTGKSEVKSARHCWISSERLTENNTVERCMRMGRYRWRIENNILTEKHQGYMYEHCYSYTWNAMEGYHYLMKIAHFLNVLATHSELLIQRVETQGIRGFIAYLRKALSCILNREDIIKATIQKYQLRLV